MTLDRVRILDTTLRDLQMRPSLFALGVGEQLRLAHGLAELGVDALELGDSIVDEQGFRSAKAIAAELRGPVVCVRAGWRREDIQAAARITEVASRGRIQIVHSIETVPAEARWVQRERIARVSSLVGFARSLCDDVEWTAEGAGSADRQLVIECAQAAIDAGATVLRLRDRHGHALPDEVSGLVAALHGRLVGINEVVLGVDCGDGLGLGVANSLAAIRSGARSVACGLRLDSAKSPTASLDGFVRALCVRRDTFLLRSGIDVDRLDAIRTLLVRITIRASARHQDPEAGRSGEDLFDELAESGSSH